MTVRGTGRVTVVPDLLVASLGAEVVAGSVQDALSRCSLALRAMIVALEELGTAGSAVGTTGASVHAAHDVSGWRATQQLTARLRSPEAAGEVLTAVLAAGGNAARLHSLTPAVEDDAEPLERARRLAFADALATARLYAELAGRELGRVISVNEGSVSGGPATRSFKAAAMPIESGTLEITAGVTVGWSFGD